ncbi:MAG: NAD+ synthase [Rhodospirillaceae bacterium]|jgi:NAD+ synthase|nr:NAD+ synthase [Rhodospirillaceae bacterium]
MTDILKIAMAQINPTVGDIAGNADLVRAARGEAAEQGADLVVFGELVLCGYPPEDLVLKGAFQDAVAATMQDLAAETADGGPALLVTAPWRGEDQLYNAVLLLDGGEIAAVRYKHDLPNFGVFDEKRVFAAGPLPGPINFRGVRLGVPICEDIWTPDVCECLVETGAELLIVPNGSPFEDGKFDVRMNHAVARVLETGLPLAYVNQVGGQDELVFDGGSFVVNADHSLALQMPTFTSGVVMTEWRRVDDDWTCAPGPRTAPHEGLGALYRAVTLGLRDYVNKNRFPGVVLGLSGGIDSALSAAIAVDALGPDRVWCVMLPSKYSSEHSLADAVECAELLKCRLDKVAIEPAVTAYESMLGPLFEGREPDITEENIQSRARGMTLMAISNKFGHMVLTTGNKSEMSVGYATIYGDMCGGFSVLKDVYKITAFELARWRNQQSFDDALGPPGRVIPENTITKPPSAELRPDQKDEDSLPPYEALDDILRCLVEEEMAFEAILARGHDAAVVRRIEHLLYLAEYKRRQAPPGVKLTARNFGRDRRYPITNGFRNAR